MKSLRVILVHGLKNTLVPLITTMGPMLMGLLTGSTVCEQIFSIPGIGSLFITAIQSNDYNIVITLAFIYSAIYIGIMLVIDILYGIIDPRIRLSGGKKKWLIIHDILLRSIMESTKKILSVPFPPGRKR